MKFCSRLALLLLSVVLINNICLSQDTLTTGSTMNKLNKKNWPKKLITLTQNAGDSHAIYKFDKATKNIFEIRTWNSTSDTSYGFYFIEGELLRADLALKPKRRKDWKRYFLTFSNGQYTGSKYFAELHRNDIVNVLQKAKELYAVSTILSP